MTKAEFCAEVALKTGSTVSEATKFVEAYNLTVQEKIHTGITMRGFGTYLIKTRKAMTARNIKTREPIAVPEKRVPVLKFSKEVKPLF